MRPNESDLMWKQNGVKELAVTGEPPLYIQWLLTDYPSQDGTKLVACEKILIAAKGQLADSCSKEDILASLGNVSIGRVD